MKIRSNVKASGEGGITISIIYVGKSVGDPGGLSAAESKPPAGK